MAMLVRVLILLNLSPGSHVHGLVSTTLLVHPACCSQPLELFHPLQLFDLVLVLQLLLHDVLGSEICSVCCASSLLLAFCHFSSRGRLPGVHSWVGEVREASGAG